MKKKFKLLLVLVIAVLTLAMVGYAAWYITRDPKSVNGNVEAYDVTGGEIEVVLCDEDGTTPTTNTSIIFGKPNGASNTGKWLQYGNSDEDENLVVYFKVTATSAGTFTLSSKLMKSSLEQTTHLFTGATFDVIDGSGSISGSTLTISAAR